MSPDPSRFRKPLLAVLALGSVALAACVAEAPARPGVDYGYVAGTYSSAPTPYAASPYEVPYSQPYDDGYYGYNNPYYGGPYYSGGYYGPSTTYIYTRDLYYPSYGYRSRGNSYRDDRSSSSHDRDDHRGRDHGDRGEHGDHRGDDRHSGGRGDWNHDRPGRPDGHTSNASPHQDDHPRPVMGGGRPLLGGALGGNSERRDPPPKPAPAAPAKPDRRHSFRDQRARD